MPTTDKSRSQIVMAALKVGNIQVTGPRGERLYYEGLECRSSRDLIACKISILGHDLRFPRSEEWIWSDGAHTVSSTFFYGRDTAITLLEKAYSSIASGRICPIV